jgi:hypothetical protein
MNPFWVLLLTLSLAPSAWARVRHVEMAPDQVATVRTAIGIATIVQVPDRPNSIVVGDQGAFKVEYLDQAITIKPLRGGAKSNLYVYTDFRRYNVQLVTGAEANADYVVYLDNEKAKPAPSALRWTAMQKWMDSDGVKLMLVRVARTRDGVLLFEFRVSAVKAVTFKPEWLWLTQNGVTRPIQNLFLSSLELKPGIAASGTMQVIRADVDNTQPLRLELRRKKISFLTIPKVAQWK